MEIFLFLFFIFLYFLNWFFIVRKYGAVYAFFHPINFLSGYLIIFFILPIFFKSFYIPESMEYLNLNLEDNLQNVLYLVICVYFLLSIINIYFVCTREYAWNKKDSNIISERGNNNKNNGQYGITLNIFIVLYMIFLSLILSVLIFLSGGIGSVFNNISEFTIKIRNGNTFFLMIIYTVEILPMFYLLFTKKVSKLFLSFLIACSMLLVTMVGARTLIVSIFISLILVVLRESKLKEQSVSLIKFSKFLVVCFVFFVLSSVVRNVGNNSDRSFDINERAEALLMYWSNNSDQLFTTIYVIEKLEKNQLNYQLGYTIVDAVYFFIPNILWEHKPKSFYPSRLIFNDIITSGIENNTKLTINFGMIARPYLDFGTLGVIVLNLFLFIYLFKKYNQIIFRTGSYIDECGKYNCKKRIKFFKSCSYKRYKGKRVACNHRKNITLLCNIYIYSHIHQIYILGIWSHVLSIIIFNMVVIFLVYYAYNLFRNALMRF